MNKNEQTLELLMQHYCRTCEYRNDNKTMEECLTNELCMQSVKQIYKEALGYYSGKK